MWCPGNPNPVETEEADPRARPAFGLDVDFPGATRICSLLVRGIMSFRISPNQIIKWLPLRVETERDGRACDAYNGSWYTPAGLNLFEKPCPRLWMT